ncbi:hypothetical protein IG631_13823 [Alternaria alternata]|nr:hypothetical protein IG631_13823 [Alternaria alternata]
MSMAASTEVTIMNVRSDMTRGWKSSDVEGRDPISVSNEVVLFAPDNASRNKAVTMKCPTQPPQAVPLTKAMTSTISTAITAMRIYTIRLRLEPGLSSVLMMVDLTLTVE